jgi:hypothetical protein
VTALAGRRGTWLGDDGAVLALRLFGGQPSLLPADARARPAVVAVAAGPRCIYRRWQSKAELVVDALNSLKGGHDIPDTGSLRQDLHALASDITDAENNPAAALTVGMVNALAHDAELRRVFRAKFIAPRMAVFRTVFERAVARGEMPAGRDLDLLARLFPALGLQQLVTSGELPDTQSALHIMDEIVYPLAIGTRTAPDIIREGKP